MTDTFAKIRTTHVVLNPTPAAQAPTGSLFIDSDNADSLTTKTVGGSNQQVGASTSSDLFIKRKQNKSGVAIPIGKRVSVKSDGSICLSDDDDPVARKSIGMSMEEILDQAFGNILTDGPNAAGSIVGLGFHPGDDVYLSSVPGVLTNNAGSFDPVTDVIMKVGVADCTSGAASATATDLIMRTEVVSSPSGG